MKKLTIGILGLGVVGTGVLTILAEQQEQLRQRGIDLTITKALVRKAEDKTDLAKKYHIQLVHDAEEILTDSAIDIVVEVIGKIHPAKEFITTALKNGKHVVTANKDLLALHGEELSQLAQQQDCFLYYEASVAGGIPILRTLQNSYLADEITEISGIINGTTNYMLTQMKEKKLSYEESLSQAQQLGFAESDPTNDVDGFDAAYKTILLTAFAFDMSLSFEELTIEGIRDIQKEDIRTANRLGYEIKLIGRGQRIGDAVYAEVAPMWVPQHHPLATIRNEFNGVFVKSRGIGSGMYYGPGAGARPTATSVVTDLATIAENLQAGLPKLPFYGTLGPKKLAAADKVLSRYYLSFTLSTEEMPQLRQQLAAAKITGTEVLSPDNPTRFVLLTDPLTVTQVQSINVDANLDRRMKILEE
ncbi:homoserine dehydrogenase [Enterococcus massiliensis]|uniref:homoserine dehydrogenase n=1 Tax=Enterococcus massiliensis TaxID=1640685 RepID=UPI00065E4117|nr:homoserine dehydrogenase [Enterococcus massiliensis]